MARITISLPDDLKAQLDDFALHNDKPVSEIVQLALRTYFTAPQDPQPIPAPPMPVPEVEERMTVLELAFKGFLIHHESVRLVVEKLARGTPNEILTPQPFPIAFG